jgi:glycosyltransferase involved in cell wall biosynthesis
MTKIVVGIFVDKFCPKIGGPYFIIKETISALKNIIKVKLFYYNDGKFNKTKNLNNILKKIDICHFYGGWTFFHIKTIYTALKLKKKIVIHPLGYYEPWSLKQKIIKKKIAWHFYQKKILLKSDLIHCASKNEENNLLKLDHNFKTVVLPYGIQNSFIKKNNFKKEINKKAIFFSRIHPKKGVENLIKAWNAINNRDWTLDIMGPYDNEKYMHKLKKLAHNNKNIFFLKPVYNDKEKKFLFAKYDFLVLPTHNENFGMVILEALARGLPVLTNHNAPWYDIKISDAGWFISENYEDLLFCLKKIFKTNIKTFRKKSLNAIKVAKNYSWTSLVKEYVNTYRKVLTK